MPQFNLPTEDDPQFNTKIIDLLNELFDRAEADTKDFKPISAPTEGTQVGSMYYDTADDKIKVVTPSGVKIVKYE